MNKSENLFFGDLLQQWRTRKRLNQKQLAELVGVSREAVSLWERGYYKPDTETILYEIARVLGLKEQERQQLFEAYTVTALAVFFHNPPLERNPYFTGRSPQLTDLHTLLMVGKQVALTQAISGLGGIGKTQLALEYAYRYQKSYHDIFWVIADTYESLMTSYARLAALLHLPEYDEPDQNKVKAAVQHWLSKHKGWLLILDNIEDLSLIHQFVPVDRHGAVLLTTRRQVTEPVAQALELGTLPENDGILFLLKRTKILTFDMSLGDASVRDIASARTITRALGNLPLALDQAGAYILETKCSFASYLDLFQKHQDELLRRRAGEIPTDHPDSVATTFTLSFQQVQQRSEVAAELLRVCSFLAPDDIGEEILVRGAGKLGPILQPLGSDDLLLNQAIEALRTFSLIQRDPEKKTLTIHRLVQAALQNAMPTSEQVVWTERIIAAMNTVIPDVEYMTWNQWERLLPHALACVNLTQSWKQTNLDLASLLFMTARYLDDRARYTEAEPLYQRALGIYEQTLGPEHPQAARPLNNLALVYTYQGKYEQAEPLYQRALSIVERALGPEHIDVAYLLPNLGMLYGMRGKYEQAESLYQRALHIFEQELGLEHPYVASTLNGLAILYSQHHRYEQAEPLYQRILSIMEQALGLEHPNVAYALNNLGLLYIYQGKYEQAEPLYQRALSIREQALEPEHIDMAGTLSNLGLLYTYQGKYEQAEPLYQRALSIVERALGPEHIDVAATLNGLALLYTELGRYTEAEPLYQRALAICEQQFGPQDPNIAEVLDDFASSYSAQSKLVEAESLYQRALAIREQSLGQHHPKTVETRKRYVALLREMGRQDEAALLEAPQPEQAKTEEEQGAHPEEGVD